MYITLNFPIEEKIFFFFADRCNLVVVGDITDIYVKQ